MSRALRVVRDELVADTELRGRAFGEALSDAIDDTLVDAATQLSQKSPWVIMAMGSYARRELCPGSDVDLMLLHAGGKRDGALVDAASRLWYPLWDAGFVLGQSVRTVKEALAVADDDLDAMTALLHTRVVVGDEALAADLVARVHRLVPRRRARLVAALADAATTRSERPGLIAEMLEPNLKDGAGGLRELQAPGWVGWALAPAAGTADGWTGGVAALVSAGYLQAADPERLLAARDALLDARVALHRVTGGKSDQLPLQEQDAVARLVRAPDADALVRGLGDTARAVVWITRDLWSRLRASERGPTALMPGTRPIDDGVIVRDDRIAIESDAPIDTCRVLKLAARAAQLHLALDRDTLARIAGLGPVVWTPDARAEFLALLRAGRGAIPVFEALDHVGVLGRLLPEWEHIRARPQRNAYHRFTVDRHSLEAVAECAALLDTDDPAGSGFDGDVARRARSDLLLLGALLHDAAKGRPGDHSVLGVDIAREVGARIGVDDAGVELLAWLVRNHLLLAETATRRDLSDETTITRFGRIVGEAQRNDLLYALTIGDSRATGPAAWNSSKAALVRELYVKTDNLLEDGVVGSQLTNERRDELSRLIGEDADEYLDALPPAYATAFSAEELARHRELILAGDLAIEWDGQHGSRHRCTVVAPDRTGLLSVVAGALALFGFDIGAAVGYSHHDGMALEVFTGVDRFSRLTTESDREAVKGELARALAGELDLAERLRERTRRYRPRSASRTQRDVQVLVDNEASSFATVVEVHAPDDIGLLAMVTRSFAELDLDVSQAIVSTLGDRVVDVFYLRDATGSRLTDPHAIDSLRATLQARLTREVTLD